MFMCCRTNRIEELIKAIWVVSSSFTNKPKEHHVRMFSEAHTTRDRQLQLNRENCAQNACVVWVRPTRCSLLLMTNYKIWYWFTNIFGHKTNFKTQSNNKQQKVTEKQGSHASLKVIESTWIFFYSRPWKQDRSLKVLKFTKSNCAISATSLNIFCIKQDLLIIVLFFFIN